MPIPIPGIQPRDNTIKYLKWEHICVCYDENLAGNKCTSII